MRRGTGPPPKATARSVLVLAALTLWYAGSGAALGQDVAERETPAQRARRMAWWREAKFGMFIHWGLYAIPAGEWRGRLRFAVVGDEPANVPDALLRHRP